MSGRMLQRALRNYQAEARASGIASDVDPSDSGGDEDHQGSVGNPFDLLGLQDDDGSEEGDVERDPSQLSAAGSASTSAPVVASKSKRKKNKGKKKGKKEQASIPERPQVVDDMVDELLERLVIGNGGTSSSISSGSPSQVGKMHRQNAARELPNILAVDTKFLRAEDELRRIFGSKVIKSVERRGEGAGAQRRRQGPGSRRTGRSAPWRKSVLVVPMDHWSRWDGGITMDCVKVEGPIQYFRYQYSLSYQEVQKKFESCVASHDPNTIVMLLRSHPYHVDSLLALAEVCKQMGEYQQAADLLEQCLYALECAWHPSFNPSLGTCRLEFSCDTNKALFLSLFRHMQHLGRRGCHRTALEVCKLLLSLDPSDPLGALFCIDYFALRAEQYEWLECFVDEYETDKSLALLPNFSFSVAVACFHLEAQQSDRSSRTSARHKEVIKGDMGNHVTSAKLLEQALMLHPTVLKRIIEKAPIKEDSSWTKIITHHHFSRASEGGPTLEHLTNIYVERNYLIWRSPERQSWLKEAAAAVTKIADKSLDPTSNSEMANWECVRKEVFDSNDNEYKHLHVSEFSDSTSTLPPEDMPQLGLGFHAARGLGRDGVVEGELAPPFEEGHFQEAVHQAALQGRNALLVFLQSLVPWMDYGAEASLDDAPALLEEGSDHNDSFEADDDRPL